jgi:acetyl esterase
MIAPSLPMSRPFRYPTFTCAVLALCMASATGTSCPSPVSKSGNALLASDAPDENQKSKPSQLDTNYFANQRPENCPAPGPSALSRPKETQVEISPQETTTIGAPAAQGNAPDPNQAGGDQTFTYKKFGEVELPMKITYPPGWKPGGKKLPAIVLFFGGGWHAGEITQFRVTAPLLAERGMIVVMPDYRTIQKHGVTPVQCLADAKSAMRYVYKNAGALGNDASRVAAGGISAGGHLAAATAFSKGFDDPDDDLQVRCKPSALVLIVPVIDNGPGGFAHGQIKDYWKAFSPMHNIGPNPPPTLFMVGDLDKYIPVATAHRFKAEMEKHGGRCDLKIYEKADHAFNFSPTGSKATQQDMDDFLVSLGYLK